MRNDLVEFLVPFCAVLVFFIIVFGFAALMRYFRYKETIALAERGLLHPSHTKQNGNSTLRWGIVITFLGLGLSCSFLMLGRVESDYSILGGIGLLPLFFGLALIVTHAVTKGNGVSLPHTSSEDVSSEDTEAIPDGKG